MLSALKLLNNLSTNDQTRGGRSRVQKWVCRVQTCPVQYVPEPIVPESKESTTFLPQIEALHYRSYSGTMKEGGGGEVRYGCHVANSPPTWKAMTQNMQTRDHNSPSVMTYHNPPVHHLDLITPIIGSSYSFMYSYEKMRLLCSLWMKTITASFRNSSHVMFFLSSIFKQNRKTKTKSEAHEE